VVFLGTVLPVIVVVLGAGALCVAWGVLVERRWYRLVRHRLDILPAGDGGPDTLTVLHLSDLHFVANDRKKSAFLASLPTIRSTRPPATSTCCCRRPTMPSKGARTMVKSKSAWAIFALARAPFDGASICGCTWSAMVIPSVYDPR
jgi:hypothetical protein